MPTIQWTLDVKEDGATLPGFPITKSVVVTESLGRATYTRPTGAGFTELQLGDLGSITVFFLQPSETVTLRFNDQTDQGLPLSSNGIMVLIDGAIPGTATNKIALENTSGSTVTLTQLAGGS